MPTHINFACQRKKKRGTVIVLEFDWTVYGTVDIILFLRLYILEFSLYINFYKTSLEKVSSKPFVSFIES